MKRLSSVDEAKGKTLKSILQEQYSLQSTVIAVQFTDDTEIRIRVSCEGAPFTSMFTEQSVFVER